MRPGKDILKSADWRVCMSFRDRHIRVSVVRRLLKNGQQVVMRASAINALNKKAQLSTQVEKTSMSDCKKPTKDEMETVVDIASGSSDICAGKVEKASTCCYRSFARRQVILPESHL